MLVAPFRHLLASSTPKLRRFAACSILVLVALYSREGAASEEFPEEVRETLQLDCTPTCMLCHLTEAGGPGNLNNYGIKNGMGILAGIPEFYAPNGVASTRNTDMDPEGVSDRDEIIANTHPGTTEKIGICSDAVYGCGAAQMAPGDTPRTSVWGLVAALGVAALLLRQLRRA